MPSYQFVTYETYNIADTLGILNEAMRVEGYCDHVPNPEPPIMLYGVSPFDMLADLQTKISAKTTTHFQKNRAGERVAVTRKMRADAHVILSGVVSIPRDWDDENKDMANACFRDVLTELKRRYGKNLRSALMHDDETNRHVHFYVYDDSLDLSKVCTATAAEHRVDPGKKKQTGAERYKARSKALITFQDEWYANVFSKYGFSRLGPRRSREPRSVALARRQEREALARQSFDIARREKIVSKAVAGISGVMMMQQIQHNAVQATMSQTAKIRHQANVTRAAIAAGHDRTLASIGL